MNIDNVYEAELMIRHLSHHSRAGGTDVASGSEQVLKSLLAEIEQLDRGHAASRKSRKVAHRLQPFLAFVERYSSAVDVGIQGVPSPAAVVWGCLRAVLTVSLSFRIYAVSRPPAYRPMGQSGSSVFQSIS